jgi:hypothetical protein
MSTADSSGFAASSTQARQPGDLGNSLASFSDDLKSGANTHGTSGLQGESLRRGIVSYTRAANFCYDHPRRVKPG